VISGPRKLDLQTLPSVISAGMTQSSRINHLILRVYFLLEDYCCIVQKRFARPRAMLARSHMPDRTKARGQMKYSLWSSRLEEESEADNPTSEESTLTKSPEPMEEDHVGSQDPHRVVAPAKRKKQKKILYLCLRVSLNILVTHCENLISVRIRYLNRIILSRVGGLRVTITTGSSSDDWIYLHLGYNLS
jgi:hypothetical protein